MSSSAKKRKYSMKRRIGSPESGQESPSIIAKKDKLTESQCRDFKKKTQILKSQLSSVKNDKTKMIEINIDQESANVRNEKSQSEEDSELEDIIDASSRHHSRSIS